MKIYKQRFTCNSFIPKYIVVCDSCQMEYGGEAGGKYEHERQISFALNFILHTENPHLRRSKVQEKLQKNQVILKKNLH